MSTGTFSISGVMRQESLMRKMLSHNVEWSGRHLPGCSSVPPLCVLAGPSHQHAARPVAAIVTNDNTVLIYSTCNHHCK